MEFTFNYHSLSSLIQASVQEGCTISRLVLAQQAAQMEQTEEALYRKMEKTYRVMAASIEPGCRKNLRSTSGLTGGSAYKMRQVSEAGKSLTGPLLSGALYRALAVSELNASMGRIVAAPTAGSCGILPAVLLSVGKKYNASEQQMLDEIAAVPFVNIGILGANKEIVPDKCYTWPVESAVTEKAMTAKHGTKYLRLTLTDHLTPHHLEVDRFVRFYKTLSKGAWLHFHCFAGKGRTTTFMVMYDMLKNADKVSFDDIVMRQFAIGGINLTAYNPNKPVWRQKAVTERIEFLKDFYQYVKANPKLQKSWTQWATENNLPLAAE